MARPTGDQRQPADTARAWCLPGQARLGVSVEFDVKHGSVTVFGIAQQRDGAFRFVASPGRVVAGPLLRIGNTTSRVDFGCDPGEWADAWAGSGISHHWALGTGNLMPDLRATADLLGTDLTEVTPCPVRVPALRRPACLCERSHRWQIC